MIPSLFNNPGSRRYRWTLCGGTLKNCLLAAGVIAVLLAAACSLSSEVDATSRLKVVTTTALLADMVASVGGAEVEVRSIVPPGADSHSFQTTPDHSVAVSEAGVIVSNGFGLDGFLQPVLQSAAGADLIHAVAASGLEPEFSGDPHFWQNPMETTTPILFRPRRNTASP